ncbi:MAG TPA: GNAT family N-acetyltransferase [Anaerolineales bacterium]|nr:GNAT family N-acetyltransferase [Anaerolineales bacterium]
MRQEIVPLHPPKVTVGRQPPDELSDGVVRLHLPTHLDIDRIVHYGSDPSQFEGFWIPGPQPGQDLYEWASTFLQELSAGWTPVGGIYGGGLVVDESEPFLGIAYLAPISAEVVSLSYGVAPQARRRGIASRAVRLATEWALIKGSFHQVELRIAKSHHESQRVAEKAGFHFVEQFLTYVEGTGETFEDLLYVCTRSDSGELADS